MKPDMLIQNLKSVDSQTRLQAVQIIGLVEETLALPALRTRHSQETDPTIKQTIEWAGKRAFTAQQQGRGTLDSLFQHFGVNKVIASYVPPEEEEAMKRMQAQMDQDMARLRQQASRSQLTNAAIAGAVGAAVGGGMMGASMAGQQMLQRTFADDSEKKGQDGFWKDRVPAMIPSTMDISMMMKRVQNAALPANQRIQSIVDITSINNVQALAPFAALFTMENVITVKEALEKYGKILYWQQVYYTMEKDGSLQQEIDRRLEALGKKPKPSL